MTKLGNRRKTQFFIRGRAIAVKSEIMDKRG